MAYRVDLRRVQRKIVQWGLSDAVFIEVHLHLNQLLPQSPTSLLRRTRQPFDGMIYEFSLVDPDNRLREHAFAFLVVYGQDEETLIVANAGYQRRDGL